MEVKAEAGVGRSTDVVSKPSEPNQVSPRLFLDKDQDFISFSKFERLPVLAEI